LAIRFSGLEQKYGVATMKRNLIASSALALLIR
jgi:hypothetical protein